MEGPPGRHAQSGRLVRVDEALRNFGRLSMRAWRRSRSSAMTLGRSGANVCGARPPFFRTVPAVPALVLARWCADGLERVDDAGSVLAVLVGVVASGRMLIAI